jgi:TPP-dependent pyruvate/acetoin dehydrogenase alpha subunit
VTLIELMTFRRKGHAEHDNQSYVPPGQIEKWAAENDPISRYHARLTSELEFAEEDLAGIDARIANEVDAATDEAERSPWPEAVEALEGVYATPPVAERLWFREGEGSTRDTHERPEGWGTFQSTPAVSGDH